MLQLTEIKRRNTGRWARTARWMLAPSLALLMIAASTSPSFAYRLVQGYHVVRLQGSLVPSSTVFSLDNPAGSPCSGGWITWDGNSFNAPAGFDRATNVKTVWAMLLAAKLSGKPVAVYLDDNVCTGLDIYIDP